MILALARLGTRCGRRSSSKAYETGSRRAALATHNFAGDLGKVTVPALVGLGATAVGWRLASAGYGALGLAAAATLLPLLMRLGAGAEPSMAERRPAPAPGADRQDRAWGERRRRVPRGSAGAVGAADQGDN